VNPLPPVGIWQDIFEAKVQDPGIQEHGDLVEINRRLIYTKGSTSGT
jgi:hypothetical protein